MQNNYPAPDVLQVLARLVEINSVNPAYEGGRPECEIATWIASFFAGYGIETWQQQVFPGRPNLIARLPGRDPHRRLIFEAHTDTVNAGGMDIPPFDPVVSEGKLFGRGSCDTKAGLAAMMCALVSLKQEGTVPPCEIWVVAAADEEFSFRGVVKLCEELQANRLTAAGAVIAEPTSLRLAIASKGVLRWRICCRGKSAHSSKPHLGVNAIANMARLIVALEADNQQLAARPHPLLGSATCNIGLISGGRQVNFVPDFCAIELDRRLLPGEEIPDVLAHYQAVLDRYPELDAYMEPPMLEDYPLETAASDPFVACAGGILGGLGLAPEPLGVPYGSDASKLGRIGIPSVIFGPGSIDQAHAAVEWVECDQVRQACEFYRGLMLRFE
ncbi:MAG TPA: M20 family metallopeptidase [Bryobacteraceae bacterium]|jgi:acetylornithine deacetylase|nr:M20 family metallopeptidase [Bryobacteraceae bacterium]